MADLAEIGYIVDTASLTAGTKALDDHAQAAKRVSTATDQVTSSGTRAAPGIRQQREEIRSLAEAAAVAGGPLGNLISQSGLLYIGSLRISPALIGTAVAVGAATAAIYDGIKAYAEFEKQQTALANALALTANASGQTVEALRSQAVAMSQFGTVTATEVQAAEAELLKFRAIAGDTFTQAIKLAQGLATTGFADLKTATQAFGKALSDPIAGLKDLEAAGVHFTPVQARLIEQFVQTGQTVSAQNEIMKIAAAQIGDANVKAADTLAGAWGRLVNTLGNSTERIGKIVDTFLDLKSALTSIADAIDQIGKNDEYYQQKANERRTRIQVNAFPIQPIAPPLSPEELAAWEQAREKIDAVTISLQRQLETAGLSAIAAEAYTKSQEAGVEGLKAEENAIYRLVAARHALADTKAATDQIKEQTAAAQIEVTTFGMDAAAAAAYRVEMDFLNRERIKGVPLTQSQIDAVHREAQAYGDVEKALEHLRAVKQASDAVSGDLANAFADIAMRTKTLTQAIDDLTKSLIRYLAQAVLAGQGPFAGLFGTKESGGIFGSLISAGINAAGGGSTITPFTAVTAGVGHAGGIVGSLGEFRYIHASYFDDAPHFQGGGIAGDETPIVAHRGEGIFTQEQMRALGGSGGSRIVVNNFAAPGTKTEVQERNEGGVSVIDLIHTTVNDGMATGKYDQTQRARFGTPLMPRSR